MIVTGQTNSSRLSELRKFIASTDITKQYFSGGSWTNNGVDYSQLEYTDIPTLQKIVYYIDGIKFTDYVLDGITTFQYTAMGTGNTHNFIQPPIGKDYAETPIYKDPKKENIISLPKIDNDVFIIRQQLSAFENNYLLEYINNLSELRTFVAGNYFNIVNNT